MHIFWTCSYAKSYRPNSLLILSQILGGPDMSMASFAERGEGNLVKSDERLGKSIDNWTLLQSVGCHGHSYEDPSSFYRPGVQVPPTLGGCNDNIAMIELAHKWRFYYIFRPGMYTQEATDHVYRTLLSNIKNGDVFWRLIGNIENTPNVSVLPNDFHELQLPTIMAINTEWVATVDLGHNYNTNNPWTFEGDPHACMPGVPDDEMNLMFFLLWSWCSVTDSRLWKCSTSWSSLVKAKCKINAHIGVTIERFGS